MPTPIDPHAQTMIDAIPASGTITYEALKNKLLSNGQAKAVNRFHQLRRDGLIAVTFVKDANGQDVLTVSRK